MMLQACVIAHVYILNGYASRMVAHNPRIPLSMFINIRIFIFVQWLLSTEWTASLFIYERVELNYISLDIITIRKRKILNVVWAKIL